MGQITADQSQAVMAALTTNVDWSQIDFEGLGLQDAIIRDPKKAGEQFTAFLRNRAQVIVGEPRILKIDRSKPFNPAEFIGVGWTIWRGPKDGNGLEGEEEQDARSLALTEIDLSLILLDTCLKQGESSTIGEERIKRLNATNRIKLDAKAFQTLWENRNILPERFKQKTGGSTTYIFCDGTSLRSPDGDRYALCFCCSGGEWRWDCGWLGDSRSVGDPSAVLASKS